MHEEGGKEKLYLVNGLKIGLILPAVGTKGSVNNVPLRIKIFLKFLHTL